LSAETLLPFLLFAAAMVGTPGPANMVALAAGARFGLRACLGLILGLVTGKALLNIAMGAGLVAVIRENETIFLAAKWASAAYMVWLAWRIAGSSMTARQAERPLRFRDGVIVHPLNPKAWAMTLGAFTQFTDPSAPWLPQVLAIMAGFAAVQLMFHTLWCAAGDRIASLIAGTRAERALMIALGLLTLATIFWAMTR
jgi:threonine/homoserine/homoserine lactone efflux protein